MSITAGRSIPSSFDNKGPLPHHLHQKQEHALLVGQEHKPEAYYFSPQMNNYGADFPYTFMGLEPGTTPEQVRHCLEIWEQGDNHITDLSRAYRLELGTGWYIPPGLLHAPGSLCTYEPQWASDVFSMYQSLVSEVPIAWDLLVKNVPPDKRDDMDYLLDMLDWDANLDPTFKNTYFRVPVDVKPIDEMRDAGLRREVDHVWESLFCRQGTDRAAGTHRDDSGSRTVRVHHGPGTRYVWASTRSRRRP